MRDTYQPFPPLSVVTTPQKQTNAFKAVIRTQGSTQKVPKPASQVVHGRMQLTPHATRRTPHGASRLVSAMYAWSDVLRPGIAGVRGSMVIRLRVPPTPPLSLALSLFRSLLERH